MARKGKSPARGCEKRPGSPDRFVRLYHDLLDSGAFHDLTANQKALYLYCVRETHGAAMRDNLGDVADGSLFYMNRALRVERHGLYSPNERRGFERDMSALISHGFVDCVESNHATKRKNLYRLSARWHKWGTDAFEVPENAKTRHMRARERKGRREVAGAGGDDDNDGGAGAPGRGRYARQRDDARRSGLGGLDDAGGGAAVAKGARGRLRSPQDRGMEAPERKSYHDGIR